MKVKNTLAKNIETASSYKVSLDTACKKLLANKTILSWILKNCVEEYKDCTLKDIEEKYIEGIPEIAQTPVHQDETIADNDKAETIEGARSEESSMTEGTVTYDIKFNALRPLHSQNNSSNKSKCKNNKPKTPINMIINVEGQTKFNPGYPIIKRGIYYGGRMISSQYGAVFTESHYEKIKKVYSIWVCLNPPKYRRNSINVYSFSEKHLVGNSGEKRKNYDLITVIMICLSDGNDVSCNGLLRMLSVLLSTKKSADEKKTILENEFNIAMTKEMTKEANNMCDLGEYIEEQAMKKGEKRGRKQGIAETLVKNVEAAMQNLAVDLQNACKILGTSVNEYQAAKEMQTSRR